MSAGREAFERMPATWVGHPDSLGQVTVGVTIFLCVASILIMGLRMWVRSSRYSVTLDDWSMLVATLFFTICCVFACMGVYAGIGTKDARIPSSWNLVMGSKSLVFWQIMYAWCLPFIKFSIGLTILRITTQKVIRYLIWIIVSLSVVSCMIGFFTIVLICMPMEKSWMGALVDGNCADGVVITKISYLISVLAVVTDWGCAIIPAIVVWGLQMKTKLKITVSFILALGAVASAATIVRLPYLRLYNVTEDYLYGIANIIIWSNIECGLGIIAGSLPSLRALFTFWLGKSNATADYLSSDSAALSARKTGASSNKGATLTTCHADAGTEWIPLEDSESQKRIIMARRDITVQYEPNLSQTRSRGNSGEGSQDSEVQHVS